MHFAQKSYDEVPNYSAARKTHLPPIADGAMQKSRTRLSEAGR